MLLAVLLLSVGAARADMIDTFETDTSANYVLSQSYGSGGTFNVSGGTLNLIPGSANTVSVVLDDGVNYMTPGSRWAVDDNVDGNSFMLVSTVPAQPLPLPRARAVSATPGLWTQHCLLALPRLHQKCICQDEPGCQG